MRSVAKNEERVKSSANLGERTRSSKNWVVVNSDKVVHEEYIIFALFGEITCRVFGRRWRLNFEIAADRGIRWLLTDVMRLAKPCQGKVWRLVECAGFTRVE